MTPRPPSYPHRELQTFLPGTRAEVLVRYSWYKGLAATYDDPGEPPHPEGVFVFLDSVDPRHDITPLLNCEALDAIDSIIYNFERKG